MQSISRHLAVTLTLATLAFQSGCSWLQMFQDTRPKVLPPNAGLETVIAAVNHNNSRIQSLFSNSARLGVSGYPTLNAKIAYQRPRNFRLKADGLFGTEADLGSNDQYFWFYIMRSEPPAVYFCRHDQFATSPARRMIPIDPNWVIDALGTSVLDPALPHQGPYPDPKNQRLLIRTILETPDGPSVKVTSVDAVSAWVMEQTIIDAHGDVRARSVAEGYHLDPLSNLYVPTAVRVECPKARFSMRVDLGAVEVNKLQVNPDLFALPNYPGYPPLDLGNPNLRFGPPPGTAR
jgi:hypothetical protein